MLIYEINVKNKLFYQYYVNLFVGCFFSVFSSLIQKYYDLGNDIHISGRIGPYISYYKYYDYNFQ